MHIYVYYISLYISLYIYKQIRKDPHLEISLGLEALGRFRTPLLLPRTKFKLSLAGIFF